MLIFSTGRLRSMERMERHLKTPTPAALVKPAEKTQKKREEERIRVVDREEENEKSNKCMILEVSWPCTLVKVTFKLIPARGR